MHSGSLSVADKRIGCTNKCKIYSRVWRCENTICISILQGTTGNTDEHRYFCYQTHRAGRAGHMNRYDVWCVIYPHKITRPSLSSPLSLSFGSTREDFCRVCWSVSHHQCRERGERHSLSRRQSLWQQCSKEIPKCSASLMALKSITNIKQQQVQVSQPVNVNAISQLCSYKCCKEPPV